MLRARVLVSLATLVAATARRRVHARRPSRRKRRAGLPFGPAGRSLVPALWLWRALFGGCARVVKVVGDDARGLFDGHGALEHAVEEEPRRDDGGAFGEARRLQVFHLDAPSAVDGRGKRRLGAGEVLEFARDAVEGEDLLVAAGDGVRDERDVGIVVHDHQPLLRKKGGAEEVVQRAGHAEGAEVLLQTALDVGERIPLFVFRRRPPDARQVLRVGALALFGLRLRQRHRFRRVPRLVCTEAHLRNKKTVLRHGEDGRQELVVQHAGLARALHHGEDALRRQLLDLAKVLEHGLDHCLVFLKDHRPLQPLLRGRVGAGKVAMVLLEERVQLAPELVADHVVAKRLEDRRQRRVVAVAVVTGLAAAACGPGV
mmetsp:Transcript_26336/g.88526  ORF Transcript_26336/g.88526 Transcript_26336/m.88526 type:complete len:372 (+) Transcript_26336:23-1138(+)